MALFDTVSGLTIRAPTPKGSPHVLLQPTAKALPLFESPRDLDRPFDEIGQGSALSRLDVDFCWHAGNELKLTEALRSRRHRPPRQERKGPRFQSRAVAGFSAPCRVTGGRQ